MTNRKFFVAASTLATLCMGVVLLPGCGEEEQPVVQAAPPPPPPPPPAPPKATSIEELMAAHNIDPRIKFPEERAPESTEARIAILKFFDAFARGNENGVRSYLNPLDTFGLDHLVKTGQLASMATSIKQINIQTGEGRYDKMCALAEFDLSDGAKLNIQPQLWSYTSTGDKFSFEAEKCPPHMIEKLSGANWISSWYEILDREDKIAQQPDDLIIITKRYIENPDTGAISSPDALPSDPGGVPDREPIPDPTRMPGQ